MKMILSLKKYAGIYKWKSNIKEAGMEDQNKSLLKYNFYDFLNIKLPISGQGISPISQE